MRPLLCLSILSLLLLLAEEANSLRISKHKIQDKAMFSQKNRKSSTLVIAIHKADHTEEWTDQVEEDFVAELKRRLPLDECNLLENDSSETEIMLIVKCLDRTEMTHTKDFLDQMPHTIDEYLVEKFGVENIVVEHERIYKKPLSYWYGTPENLRTMMRLHYNEIQGEERERIAQNYFVQPTLEPLLHAAQMDQQNAPWNLDRISMRFGMLDSDYYYLNEGTGCDIYIVDTGIRITHVEFQGRASFLINTVGDGSDTDLNGHGTHVAGIAAGMTYGVAKNASLVAVKVLDADGDGTTSSIKLGLMAVVEAAAQKPKRRGVVNLSFGGELSSILDQAVLNMVANNLVVAVAAGNEGDNACNYSPGDLGGALNSNQNSVLSVAASDINDARPSWSNYGSCVSLTAPGVAIVSTWYTSDTAVQELSGTSMSTPAVVGVATLVLAQNMTLSVSEVVTLIQRWNTPAVIRGTTMAGGGQNLLYSLIVDNASVNVVIPTPEPTHPAQLGFSNAVCTIVSLQYWLTSSLVLFLIG